MSAHGMYVPPREEAGSPDSLLGAEHQVDTFVRDEPMPTAFAGIRLVLTAPGQVGGTLWSTRSGAAASGTPLLGSRGLSGDGKAPPPRRPATELSHQRPAGAFSEYIHERSQASVGLVGTSPSPRAAANPSPEGWFAAPSSGNSSRGGDPAAGTAAAPPPGRASSGSYAGPAPSRGPSLTGSVRNQAQSAASSASRLASGRQPQRDLSPAAGAKQSRSTATLLAVAEDQPPPQQLLPPIGGNTDGARSAAGKPAGRPERYAFKALDAASVPGMPARPFGAYQPRKLAKRRAPPPDAGPQEPPARALDGFLLLEMAGVALPELATVASVTGRNLVSVVSADMEYFPALAALDLSDNALDSAAGLAPMLELRELQLSCNRLRSLGLPPGAFAALRVLDCSYNLLAPEELVALSSLPSLAWLDCASNAVDCILPEVSAGFRALEVLSLGAQRPPLRDAAFEPLSQLPRLRVLHAPHNALAAVPPLPLDGFPSLQLLDLRSNRIRAAAALAPLGGCPLLREVLLHGNPLAQRRDLPKGGGVLALAEGGKVTLAAPEQERRRRRALDPFGIEAPLPTVAQTLAAGDRLDNVAARLEAIAASKGALLLHAGPVRGRDTMDEEGGYFFNDEEAEAAFHAATGSAFLPRDGFAEGLEAAFAEAVGFGGGDADGDGDGAATAGAGAAMQPPDWARGDAGQGDAAGPSVFLTEVDEGGPAPDGRDSMFDPQREGTGGSGGGGGGPVFLLPATHEEMVAEFGPRRRIGGIKGGGDPSQAFQALKHALDHPLTTRTGAKDPHFLSTTAAMVARSRAIAPLPVHQPRRRAPKKMITDNTQHLLDSMKNRLTAVNDRMAQIVPDVVAKKDDSDSSSDDE